MPLMRGQCIDNLYSIIRILVSTRTKFSPYRPSTIWVIYTVWKRTHYRPARRTPSIVPGRTSRSRSFMVCRTYSTICCSPTRSTTSTTMYRRAGSTKPLASRKTTTTSYPRTNLRPRGGKSPADHRASAGTKQERYIKHTGQGRRHKDS